MVSGIFKYPSPTLVIVLHLLIERCVCGSVEQCQRVVYCPTGVRHCECAAEAASVVGAGIHADTGATMQIELFLRCVLLDPDGLVGPDLNKWFICVFRGTADGTHYVIPPWVDGRRNVCHKLLDRTINVVRILFTATCS